MKIYNKIVWDKDGNVIEEDSYEYEGPVAQAMGGRPKPPPPPPHILYISFFIINPTSL